MIRRTRRRLGIEREDGDIHLRANGRLAAIDVRLHRSQETKVRSGRRVVAGAAIMLLLACGDNRPIAYLLDAPPDDAPADCCAFYPDPETIRSCAAPSLSPGTCGVIGCPRPPEDGGGFLRVNVCGPLDGGLP